MGNASSSTGSTPNVLCTIAAFLLLALVVAIVINAPPPKAGGYSYGEIDALSGTPTYGEPAIEPPEVYDPPIPAQESPLDREMRRLRAENALRSPEEKRLRRIESRLNDLEWEESKQRRLRRGY